MWSGETYRRQKLAELQRLVDFIHHQFADITNEGTRTKLADLRERILALMREYAKAG
jgi:hypothetical protein